MNVKENNPLWIKIENFPLDDAGAVINFSNKLAALQTLATGIYTTRYRRI